MYLLHKLYKSINSFFVWLSCSTRPDIYYSVVGLENESMRHKDKDKDNDTGYDNYYDIEYDNNIMYREL